MAEKEEYNEHCGIMNHCLESDFGSTELQINSADHFQGYTVSLWTGALEVKSLEYAEYNNI